MNTFKKQWQKTANKSLRPKYNIPRRIKYHFAILMSTTTTAFFAQCSNAGITAKPMMVESSMLIHIFLHCLSAILNILSAQELHSPCKRHVQRRAKDHGFCRRINKRARIFCSQQSAIQFNNACSNSKQ